MSEFSAFDHQMMTHALRLAERGAFTAKPNPMVGCVISKGGLVVGEGWHVRAGEAHAEVIALQAAGDAAKGATAYVTLEPCAHTGKTGPCADALIAAGVKRVVAAMRDPFPQVDGAGFEKLRAAGIEVQSGLMEAQAQRLNRAFITRVTRGRPWVRVKLAVSLDGRTALANGESQWISGEESREDVHRWRARCGALITGAGTILKDDPQLTVRLPAEEAFVAPLRVVLDPGLATIARGRVREGDAPTLYIHGETTKVPRGFTADIAAVPEIQSRLDLHRVLTLLAERGVNEVQLEAGATLTGGFLSQGLVDELLVYIAPVIMGDAARPMFDGLRIEHMSERVRFKQIDLRKFGDDTRVLLEPVPLEAREQR
ncbi:bifunctional diaminohydroxyphosphoribosylaminopyrimidine deaminase/5-amino-6-(5-phosphoribosylamino)uracil reductase RibD [Lysobacter soyae]|uniref:Riboflavin biosynthesis protein RibD n=1 Tax=Lysobacter soyae TaxID=2764185 RepID=A0ABX8WMQ0_9GAMM|nr:bifunctional diaminohydroxyphosphoribosylaminopyrimidine deaminase/5-amino-6-(5-phosphoribosylamino)uracil reductase RibD [Lysobacter sp. CJ11]QYR52693.1 bifunctional diaminohydroxyphosphoribosylaminopyrimidine deaminase/5-amino-6-(5-phosphoribosylamino)uracil reductase RibD [Lysobacter sp. CJ11]